MPNNHCCLPSLYSLEAPESPQRLQALILANFQSQMLKNHQATMKTRYCGHLYSSLLRKWTWWDHRDQVSYYKEGGLKGTEGSSPRVGWRPSRSPSKHCTLIYGCFNKACSDGCHSPFWIEGGLEWWLIVSPDWVTSFGVWIALIGL